MPGEREGFIEAGMDDCLIKPLDEEALWAAVERWGGTGAAPAASEGAVKREAAPVGGPLPAYDRGVAVRLAGGNEALADRLLGMLLRDLDSRHQQIRAAFAEGNWEDLRNLVHKLHGSAANCGTPALQHAARGFETSLADGELEGLERHMEVLGFEVERLMAEQGGAVAD